jgi:hypothetical protein
MFANCDVDLAPFNDEQVGLALDYIASNAICDIPYQVLDASVPLQAGLLMMKAMPALWRNCVGVRLAGVNEPIGVWLTGSYLLYVVRCLANLLARQRTSRVARRDVGSAIRNA